MQSRFEKIFRNQMQQSASLTHRSIIAWMYCMGIPSSLDGVCYGISVMAMQAGLLGREGLQQFSRRLVVGGMLGDLFFGEIFLQWRRIIHFSIDELREPMILARVQARLQKEVILTEEMNQFSKMLETFKTMAEGGSEKKEEYENLFAEALFYAALFTFERKGTNECRQKLYDYSNSVDAIKNLRESLIIHQLKLEQKLKKREEEEKCHIASSQSSAPEVFELRIIQDLLSEEVTDEQLRQLIQEIPTFLEGVFAYAEPPMSGRIKKFWQIILGDKELQQRCQVPYANMQSWQMTSNFYGAEGLQQQGGMRRVLMHVHLFDEKALANLFSIFLENFNEMAKKFVFQLLAEGHAITVGYDELIKKFWLIDANKLPIQWFGQLEKFIQAIFLAFFWEESKFEIVVIKIDCITTFNNLNEDYLQNLISQFRRKLICEEVDRFEKIFLLNNYKYHFETMLSLYKMNLYEPFVKNQSVANNVINLYVSLQLKLMNLHDISEENSGLIKIQVEKIARIYFAKFIQQYKEKFFLPSLSQNDCEYFLLQFKKQVACLAQTDKLTKVQYRSMFFEEPSSRLVSLKRKLLKLIKTILFDKDFFVFSYADYNINFYSLNKLREILIRDVLLMKKIFSIFCHDNMERMSSVECNIVIRELVKVLQKNREMKITFLYEKISQFRNFVLALEDLSEENLTKSFKKLQVLYRDSRPDALQISVCSSPPRFASR